MVRGCLGGQNHPRIPRTRPDFISRTRKAISPVNAGFRYFVVHTKCRWISNTVCAPCRYSGIPLAYPAARSLKPSPERRGLQPSQTQTVTLSTRATSVFPSWTPARFEWVRRFCSDAIGTKVVVLFRADLNASRLGAIRIRTSTEKAHGTTGRPSENRILVNTGRKLLCLDSPNACSYLNCSRGAKISPLFPTYPLQNTPVVALRPRNG